MWWVVCALVSVVTVRTTRAQIYHHDSYGGQDLDDYYDDEASPPPSRMPDALTRVRRFGDEESRTLNFQDKSDIKGALRALFSGRNVDFGPKRSSIEHSIEQKKMRDPIGFDFGKNFADTQLTDKELTPTRSRHTSSLVNMEQEWFRERAVLREDATTSSTSEATQNIPTTVTTAQPTTQTTAKDEPTQTTAISEQESPTTHTSTVAKEKTDTTASKEITDTTISKEITDATDAKEITDTTITKEGTAGDDSTTAKAVEIQSDATSTVSDREETEPKSTTTEHVPTTRPIFFTTTDTPTTVTTTPTTTTTTTKKPTGPRFDIEALLAIVANMTYDYDTKLTQQLNETLQRFSIPTCGLPTTTTSYSTSESTTEMWYNTSLVSKCFVCGMDTPGIPRNAYCADAFATDFLPLVPIDPRAKGHISRFRKYCRYFDVNNYQRNRSDSRAFLGRWTGGCAVRWIDLSGVYTQRTCRNRHRPTTGHHYGSKRMAKLELALANVDDGCVTSPMATLVPLSRGISLYARFHACVCTGNWCNRAVVMHQWITYLWLLLLVVVEAVR